MARAGQHGKILDMIALDPGEAADFLAAALRGDSLSRYKENEIMATEEERHKILEMVAAGKLSAGEGADLLAGTPTPEVAEAPSKAEVSGEPKGAPKAETPVEEKGNTVEEAAASTARHRRWLKVRVGDLESGRRKVSVNIPLSLVKFGLQVGRGFAPGLQDVDWDELSATLAEREGGLLVDVEDEEDGERVQIYVE